MPDLSAAVMLRSKLQRGWALKLVAELTDEQLVWRPSPSAHSIAWTLWHIARADDNFCRDLSGRSIWREGGYRERWGLSSDRMNRMEDADAAAMRMPAKDELLGYVRAVFEATDAALDAIEASRWTEEIDSGFVGRRTTIADLAVIVISHDGRHLGELEYIKGLQGIPGTVTV